MHPATATAPTRGTPHASMGWFARSELWLDERGKGAWIAAMVLGFVFFWPVGLALLAYMIWNKRMFSGSCRAKFSHRRNGRQRFRSSGNSAFDSYKADTLARLEDEQSSFESFLERLREAKDKAEFDTFMDERAKAAQQSANDTDDEAA